MATSNPAPKSHTDSIAVFSDGFNSGIAPLLLKKSQVSNGANFSVRGGFLKTRPPINKLTLVYPSPLLQTLVEKGFFQGAGYYRPDYGTESLLAQISGHLIKFTETGSVWMVSDVSIPGDLNSPTPPQIWMWQSEKWLIIQDGTGALPIFFDGTISRRSYGPSQVLGTAIASGNFPNPRVIGEVLTINLSAVYAGPFNVPVIFNGEFYQTVSSPAPTYLILLTPTVIPSTGSSGQPVVVIPSVLGITTGQGGFVGGIPKMFTRTNNFLVGQHIKTLSYTVPSGGGVVYQDVIYNVDQIIDANTLRVSVISPTGLLAWNPGVTTQPIFLVGSTAPNFPIGNLAADFTESSMAQFSTTIDQAYSGQSGIIVQINSNYFYLDAPTGPSTSTTLYLINLSDLTDAGAAIPTGSPAGDILSVPEIQAGRMGAYGMSRNWYCGTDGITYFAADQVGDPSGTPANNYRDSVLKETENTFQANGGSFRLPGTGDIITAMVFPPIMDTALGQGQLQVFTAFSAFSNNSPVDRTTWAALTSPLQTESLKGSGALAQNSTILVNSDVFFRSSFGIGSFVQARRDFGNNSWGNKPISNELQVILEPDNKTLLSFGSAASFDNRFISTCAPNVSGQGVFHIGMAVLNNDLISSLRTDLPPAWEGLWTGINALQLIEGRVNGSDRCFAFTFNITDQKIELHELISEADAKSSGQYKDDGVTDIVWGFESPMLFSSDIKPLGQFVRLSNGEVSLTDIKGSVTVKVSYRPLNYPCWLDYHTFTVCADVTEANSQAQYLYRIGLGEPSSKDVDPINDMPFREGPAFQFMFEITGSCTFQGAKFEAVEVPMQKFAKVLDEVTTCQASVCTPKNWIFSYSTQGLPPQPLPPISPLATPFASQTVYFENLCSTGQAGLSGSLPSWIALDLANNRLIGAAGAFRGVSQDAANQLAQNTLNAQAASLLQSEIIICGFKVIILKDDEVTSLLGADALQLRHLNGKYFLTRSSANAIFSSVDGTTWTNPLAGASGLLYDIAYGNGVYVAVGQQLLGPYRCTLYTSPDGAVWTENDDATNVFDAYSVVFGGGKFCRFDSFGQPVTSLNGVTWVTHASVQGSTLCRKVQYLNGKFFACFPSNVWSASDPTAAWSQGALPAGYNARDIAYGNNVYVAVGWRIVGATNQAWTAVSGDGITWAASDLAGETGATAGAMGVVFGKGQFVLCSESGKVFYSNNGTAWTADARIAAAGLNNIVFDGGSKVVTAEGAIW